MIVGVAGALKLKHGPIPPVAAVHAAVCDAELSGPHITKHVAAQEAFALFAVPVAE